MQENNTIYSEVHESRKIIEIQKNPLTPLDRMRHSIEIFSNISKGFVLEASDRFVDFIQSRLVSFVFYKARSRSKIIKSNFKGDN